jgi:hypothetical protein
MALSVSVFQVIPPWGQLYVLRRFARLFTVVDVLTVRKICVLQAKVFIPVSSFSYKLYCGCGQQFSTGAGLRTGPTGIRFPMGDINLFPTHFADQL